MCSGQQIKKLSPQKTYNTGKPTKVDFILFFKLLYVSIFLVDKWMTKVF